MIAMSDLFRVSLRQVVRQRGFGVILSIALGIMAFIALSVLGQEIRYKVGQDMVLMGGVNIIRVYMDDAQYPGQPRRDFSPRTVEALRKIPGVGMISENVRQGITFSLRASGERTLGVHFIGVDQYFAETYSLELVAGRMMSEEDVRGHRRICMLGREAATNLYGDPAQAVGKLLFLGKDVVEVVGVVTGVMLGEWNQGGFLPTTVMEDRNWGSGKITRLFVRAIGWEDVAPVVRQIPSVVRANQDAPYLVIATQDDQLDRIKTTFMWVEALLWLGIVASLMLGGFGIWYGTFAAVRARTREVGLKNAMRGSAKHILASSWPRPCASPWPVACWASWWVPSVSR
ncbi:ABC transporter permease [Desulfovibrio sp.]|uniref:ABC transporter permease n=1 Tax=Desulfovibrio sp. TaxID=885 RepID=UPI0030788D7E